MVDDVPPKSWFGKLKPMRTQYFEESREKEGHDISYEKAKEVFDDPDVIIPAKKGRYAFVKDGENNHSPIVTIVSCATTVAEYTGELFQISRLVNSYKNSDNRIKRLLKKSKEPPEDGE